jgi:hypothetical protein
VLCTGRCMVLTLTKRKSSNSPSKVAGDIRIADNSSIRQREALSLSKPEHTLMLLVNKSACRNVKATERIQYRVENANMEVVKARSHFRDRPWSPLALFHHENSLRKDKADFVTSPLHHDANHKGNKTQIYPCNTWRVSNQHRLWNKRWG